MKDHPKFLRPWGEIRAQDWHNWKWQFKNSLSNLAPWPGKTNGSAAKDRELAAVTNTYPFRVTPYYLSLMDVSNPEDPLRRQCFPDLKEIRFSLGGVDDPLEERRDMPVPGLIHRYADRCLILATHACAVYCRHCNRKRLWQDKPSAAAQARLEPMIAYIRQRKEIREVIVSGGDPLTLSDRALEKIIESLHAIPHVEVLRIGSRTPAVMPMRVTPALCKLLRKYRPLWFNTQFNHAREITPDAARACEMLLAAGIPVSNQSVLLRGVNDSHDVMRELLYGLQRISVRPYYLFQCDPVRGTDHFRVDIGHGVEIMEELRRNISGICMPRYVVDLPGGRGKRPLEPFSCPSAKNTDEAQHFFDKPC
ncbi:MAG: lysine 2,3-aminomutase [Syntrophus sp. (in: bacteria)]|nr:lysine 2,3-aminomutase [Syntrophus sp. (in: bacteria)]